MKERFSIGVRDADNISLDDQLRFVNEAGFRIIHLDTCAGYIKLDALREQVECAKRHGLRVVNIHPPFMRNCELWVPGEKHDETVALLMEQIDNCSALGIESIIIHPTSGPTNVYVSELGLETYQKLVEHAQARGVVLMIENLRTPIHLDYLFDNIKSDFLRFCFDSGHENAYNHGIGFVRRYGSRLGFTHLHDNDGVDDLHQVPMDGTIDWAKLRADMEYVGYTGYVNLELSDALIYGDVSQFRPLMQRAYNALLQIFGE